jgi:hypothetical protein
LLLLILGVGAGRVGLGRIVGAVIILIVIVFVFAIVAFRGLCNPGLPIPTVWGDLPEELHRPRGNRVWWPGDFLIHIRGHSRRGLGVS